MTIKRWLNLACTVILALSLLLMAGCADDEQPEVTDPPAQNGDDGAAEPEGDGDNNDESEPEEETLPESRLLTVVREGQSEELEAYLTAGQSGLQYYLLPDFELGSDQGFDILMTAADSDYLPASLTVSNNSAETTAEEALATAQSYYPGVEFGEPYAIEVDGNMQEALYAGGVLDNDWVACVGLAGENGTVSAWGQGPRESAEGLLVLLLAQLCSVVK